jgi:hypothetical protein
VNFDSAKQYGLIDEDPAAKKTTVLLVVWRRNTIRLELKSDHESTLIKGVGRKYILFRTDLLNSDAGSTMLILREKTRKRAHFIFSRNTLLTSHNKNIKHTHETTWIDGRCRQICASITCYTANQLCI